MSVSFVWMSTAVYVDPFQNIRFMRLSSDMFPFASHAIYGYSLDYCASVLQDAGDLAKKYGHRLTMHPGQYTQLGSPNPGVTESSIRELQYHCEMLDRMGVGPDGVLVIHVRNEASFYCILTCSREAVSTEINQKHSRDSKRRSSPSHQIFAPDSYSKTMSYPTRPKTCYHFATSFLFLLYLASSLILKLNRSLTSRRLPPRHSQTFLNSPH